MHARSLESADIRNELPGNKYALSIPIAGLLGSLCLVFDLRAQTSADALFTAIRSQDIPAIERLLKTEPNLASAKDGRGQSAVMIALFSTTGGFFSPPPRNASLQALLEHEPTLNFFESCATGDLGVVREALAKDPALARSWHPIGLSALHFAAFSGDAAVTTLLLDHGAEVDARARNAFLNTPLQVALLPGNEATARVLLERGADPLVRQERGLARSMKQRSLGVVILWTCCSTRAPTSMHAVTMEETP